MMSPMSSAVPLRLPASDDPDIPMPTPRLDSYTEGLRSTTNVWGTEGDDE
jgi:hypothetical protein